MTLPFNPDIASNFVIWGGLLIGLLLGAVAQGTRFCTMGALADWFSYGGTARLMMWVLAVAMAATGSWVLIHYGWLDATKTNAWSTRLLWVSNIFGGGIFGFGMVLASGCPQRNLVRAGTGSLKALVTLILAALTAQMTLRGVFSGLRVRIFDVHEITLSYPQDLGSVLAAWTSADTRMLRWAVLLVYLLIALLLVWKNRQHLDLPHYAGGIAIGLLVPVAWMLTGHLGYIPEHPETLEPAWMGTYSHRPEALTFAAPIAHTLDLLTLWSDRNNIATYGVMVCLGTMLGSTASSLMRREFRLESFHNVSDMGNHLAGAVMMGFGGVTAMGCSVGQGITGLSLQSVGAFLAVAGIVAGAWMALRLQTYWISHT